jgi:hypothetical protein
MAAIDLTRGDTSGLSFKVPEQLHKAAFSTSDWNRMKRDALMAAGWMFVRQFLPLRFTDFARRMLGYRARLESGGGFNKAYKQPLVDVGTLRDRMLASAYPEAAAAGKALFIRTPYAHPLRPEHARVLQRITPDELAAMNQVAQAKLAEDIMDAKAGKFSKKIGQQRLALTPPQRAAIAHGLKDRKGGRYHLTSFRGQRAA